jgi:hypothetical protein
MPDLCPSGSEPLLSPTEVTASPLEAVACCARYELRSPYRTLAFTDMFPGYTKSHLLFGHQICVICEICVRIFRKAISDRHYRETTPQRHNGATSQRFRDARSTKRIAVNKTAIPLNLNISSYKDTRSVPVVQTSL